MNLQHNYDRIFIYIVFIFMYNIYIVHLQIAVHDIVRGRPQLDTHL